jgi:hypothetical protein
MRPLYVGAIFKNEAMGLGEWLSHYRAFGVEHFFLINDGSTDAYEEALRPHRDVITLYQNDVPFVDGRQVLAYNKFFGHLRSQDVWLMIVDLDEFIYPPHDRSIKDVVARYDGYSQILVDWVMFGSNGHVTQPDSIRLSFTRRHSKIAPLSYKSIVQPRDILGSYAVHVAEVSGKTIRLTLTPDAYDAELVCNHYQVQSLERWQSVVMTRGCVNYPDSQGVSWRNMGRFHEFDFNDQEDLRLARRLTSPVTMVITAYNRPHLLRRTLASFVKYNTYPITKCIIIEDSGQLGINDFAKDLCPFPVECVYNDTNLGHIGNIEKAYSKVKTPFIFHCEEDWEFYAPGFIEKSFEVLEADPSVITVWLRAHTDVNNHPIEPNDRGGYRYMSSSASLHPYYGYTTNPGLRRTSDYRAVAPWSETCARPHYDRKERLFEPDICILYHTRGYKAAILSHPAGFVRHIGWTESTTLEQHANADRVSHPSTYVAVPPSPAPSASDQTKRIAFRVPLRLHR